MQDIHEVFNDYTCPDNLIHIDVYHSADENAEGKTVAVVDRDTKKVIFFDNGYRLNEKVKASIDEVLTIIEREKVIFINEEAQLQMIESVNSCEGRIENGGDVNECFKWLREEMDQIFEGVSVNDTSLTK